MSTLRVPVSGLQAGFFELDESAARYVTRVHRLSQGAHLTVFDPAARVEADAVIVRADRRRVICDVTLVRAATNVAQRPLWLLQGLSKADRFDLVVRDATALGATDIVPVAFERCDVVVAGQSDARQRRWARISVEASRQCGRGDAATIHPCNNQLQAMAMLPSDAVRLCLWEQAVRPLGELAESIARAPGMVVMIGPEGGLEAGEVELAREFGFEVVSMGPFILRTETAATAVLGAIRALTG
jgi:16S rRNA (uracil1498-N3)-methyltransferase